MKKVIFLFAMVFVVSMAMAQKTTWVDQSGVGNTANVTQMGCISGDLLSIYAVQSGTWNTLNAYQTGESNYIELYQTGDNNTANIEQLTCNINNPGPAAFGNDADIYQSGDKNTANLTQKEDDTDGWDYSINNAVATQSGDKNAYNLTQGGNEWKPTNTQYLTQSGFDNDADVVQNGYTNYSEIVQTAIATWNTANLDQNDASMNSSAIWSKSYSWQLGSNNLIDVDQVGNAGLQYAKSIQNGNTNTTDVFQHSWGVQQVVSSQTGTSDIINVLQEN